MQTENVYTVPVPSDEVMNARVAASRQKIAQWWEGQNKTPVLDICLHRQGFPPNLANDYWPASYSEPDIDKIVAEQMRCIHGIAYCADATPRTGVAYGRRSTPMVMSFFLGAPLVFDANTIWYEPIISNIRDFDPVIDPDNRYYKKHLELFAKIVAAQPAWTQTNIPGIGDYLTNLAGLRGTQELIFDVIDSPQEIHRLREKMVPLFARLFNEFTALYKSEQHGMSSWMAWAPGTTYPVQCDFSVLMNPAQFKEHVMPEVEFLSQYIKYMCWHLDGFDEIKHLDSLLACSHIKAIQFHMENSKPPNCDPCWKPYIERILGAGKSLHISANNFEEGLILYETYHDTPGVYIRCSGKLTRENAEKVEKYFGQTVW